MILYKRIPGCRVVIPRSSVYLLLQEFEEKFQKDHENGDIRFDCVKGGEAENPIYDFKSNNKKLLRRLKIFIIFFKLKLLFQRTKVLPLTDERPIA